MDFSLTEQQEILRKFAGDFLTSQYPARVVKELETGNGHSPEIWQEMSALGWMGLPFAEDRVDFHYWKATDEDLAIAERELDEIEGRIS